MRSLILLTALAGAAGLARADDTVRLRFKDYDRPAVEVEVTLLPPAARREALGRLRVVPAWQFAPWFARPGASEDVRKEALELARREFEWLDTKWSEAGASSEADVRVLWTNEGELLENIARVFTALGDASDARRLAGAVVDRHWPFTRRERLAYVAAYIEAREGTLENGALAEAVEGPDDAAAAMASRALRNFGVHRGAERAARFLQARSGKGLVPGVYLGGMVHALLEAPPGIALEPVRALFRAEGAEAGAVAWSMAPAAIYLLAWGDERDCAAVEERCFDWSQAESFAALCADPRPLWDGLLYADRLDGLAQAIFRHSANLTDIQNALLEYRSKVWLAGSRHAGEFLGAVEPEAKGEAARNQFVVLSTAYLPSSFVGSFFYSKRLGLTGTPWIPLSMWTKEDLAGAIVRRDLGKDVATLLDYLPAAEAKALLAAVPAEGDTTWLDLRLAAHAATTGGFLKPESWCFDGPQRRPYVLGTPKEGEGAIMGVAELAPALAGKTLTLSLRLDQAAYYYRGDFISASMKEEQFDTWKYLQGGGRKVVAAVRVWQKGKEAKVADLGMVDGVLRWDAELEAPGWDGVTVVVETEYFGVRHPLIFDVFAGDAARRARAGK